jgi:hypothetical protein
MEFLGLNRKYRTPELDGANKSILPPRIGLWEQEYRTSVDRAVKTRVSYIRGTDSGNKGMVNVHHPLLCGLQNTINEHLETHLFPGFYLLLYLILAVLPTSAISGLGL